jgi:molybdopterin-guanine dinucleotide biosynthesis protein A
MGGGDKPLMPFLGRTLLDHVLERLRPQAGVIAINANGDPARFAAWGLPVLPDPLPGQPGPLAGILAAMLWAGELGSPAVLTVPGDTPFLPLDLVVRLMQAFAGRAAGPVLAASGGRVHPVVGVWPATMVASLSAALARGERKVFAWADAQDPAVVAFPCGSTDPFANFNTCNDIVRMSG